MAKINDLISNFKKKLKDGITTDTSADEIARVDSLCAELDGIEQEANLNLKETSDMKDMYIKAIKNQGSKEAPKEEGATTPRTLEEIANAEVKNDK